MSMRQQKRSASRGAVRTHRLSGGLSPKWRARRESASCSSAAPLGPASSKRSRRRRGASMSAYGALDAYGHSSTASSSIATIARAAADLLLHEVLEQVGAHRARGVGAEALALARDDGGDEVQRVELRLRRGRRRAPRAAPRRRRRCTYAAPACARIRSRHTSTAARTCSTVRSASVVTGSGPLTITSWAPAAAQRRVERGLPRRAPARARRARAAARSSPTVGRRRRSRRSRAVRTAGRCGPRAWRGHSLPAAAGAPASPATERVAVDLRGELRLGGEAALVNEHALAAARRRTR